jgi:hypothetical protein
VTANRIIYTGGWGGSVVLSNNWTLTVTYKQRATGSSRDAGQSKVESRVGQTLADALIWVRWYDRNGIDDGQSGQATVAVSKAVTGPDGLDSVTVVFTGDGELTAIDNPAA